METQNTEEVVENIVNTLIYNYWDSKFDDVEEVRQWLRTTLTQLVKEVEAKGHQAGIDEAMAVLEGMREDGKYQWQKSISDDEITAYNQALDDTIKALQDNK